MTQYFIADLHFYHKMKMRPQFSSVDEMNQFLVERWNQRIQPHDEVYILGDMFFRANIDEINSTVRMLRGRKCLIIGNHDDYIHNPQFDSSAFEWIKDYHVLRYHHRSVVLSHYPILEWQGKNKGGIHLYGHVHGDMPEYYQLILGSNSLNVGADVIGFAPINIEEVISRVDNHDIHQKLSGKIELTMTLEGKGIKTFSSRDNIYEAIKDVLRNVKALWNYD